jgi:hypothetical protein
MRRIAAPKIAPIVDIQEGDHDADRPVEVSIDLLVEATEALRRSLFRGGEAPVDRVEALIERAEAGVLLLARGYEARRNIASEGDCGRSACGRPSAVLWPAGR